MPIWALAKKELRLLLRDRLATALLVGMPLLFILMLGLLLGEGFGQKADERLCISLLNLDQGLKLDAEGKLPFPYEPWSEVVRRDLAQTGGIRVEIIHNHTEADRLIRDGKRAAVLVFAADFSVRIGQCSFLKDGINPFYRDGVLLPEVGAEMLVDPTQVATSSVIEQVAQVTLIRVILPYMIGRAFEKLGEPSFMALLVERVPGGKFLPRDIKSQLGAGVQQALKDLFPNYNLTGKTWAALTKAEPRAEGGGAGTTEYVNEDGSGFLHRGAARYQILVPAYTVMFAFTLVFTVGWLYVAERRQGTLKRLKAAPITRGQVLLGKLLPSFAISLGQGLFLLAMGKVVFGMRWGPDTWSLGEQILWLFPVVATTSLAAMGLGLFLAAVARTEMQVTLGATVIVLVPALISGCLIPRELMPERTQQLGLFTPHGWALAGYRQLLLNPEPNLATVMHVCAVLCAFGFGFLFLAWAALRLE